MDCENCGEDLTGKNRLEHRERGIVRCIGDCREETDLPKSGRTLTVDDREISEQTVVDFGCGTDKEPGAVGVDSPEQEDHNTDADVRHDLNDFPYPFDDRSVDVIYLNDSLEHLESPLKTIMECHRLLKAGGELRISVPQDDPPRHNPFHRQHLSPEWFHTFDPERQEWAKGADWQDKPRFTVKTELSYHGEIPENLRDILLLPFYWLKSPDSDFYDFPRGKRRQLDVRMVKQP